MDKSLPGTEVYTIYQMNEEQTRTLCWLNAEPRTKVMYMQGGKFYYNTLDPDDREYSFGVLKIFDTNTYLGCEEYYFKSYDPVNNSDVYYRNSVGSFDIVSAEILDFTDEDFNNKDIELQQQCAYLDLTPLAEYTPSDSKFTKTAEVADFESAEPMLKVMLAEEVRENYPNRVENPCDHRRKGLAYACGAKLILECLDKGLYPSWDAQNKGSVALVEKLGYHFSHEYVAYEIRGY